METKFCHVLFWLAVMKGTSARAVVLGTLRRKRPGTISLHRRLPLRHTSLRHQSAVVFQWPVASVREQFDPDLPEDGWTFRRGERAPDRSGPCSSIRPTTKDLIRRFYAILPYFDKARANSAFLRKYAATVYGLGAAEDSLDREVAHYAAVITPLVFLQQYRDMWCLLERFHRAMRLYQISHPTEKRSALKLLQNLRAVNQKLRTYVAELPGPAAQLPGPAAPAEPEEDDIHDKKDIRYLKELIKNLG